MAVTSDTNRSFDGLLRYVLTKIEALEFARVNSEESFGYEYMGCIGLNKTIFTKMIALVQIVRSVSLANFRNATTVISYDELFRVV